MKQECRRYIKKGNAMNRKIRNAAKALIIKDDKMLAIKINDGNEEWYIMPGGGQDVEELLPEAACREVAEELGLKVEVKDLAFVIEGVHGENFHRVDLVFLCEYKGTIENAILQSEVDMLEVKIGSNTSINQLEEYAAANLAMHYPEGNECIHLATVELPKGNLADIIREKAYA